MENLYPLLSPPRWRTDESKPDKIGKGRNNNMNTISFVIPLYNEEKRIYKLFEALEKVVLPRGLKLEKIIFVSDGSTDNTLKKLKAFCRKNKNLKSQIISLPLSQCIKKYGIV